MPFTPLGLDHIVLRVNDQEASRKFYTELLGCTVERVNPAHQLVQLRFGENMIDVFPGKRGEDGLHHFCLSIRCDDLEGLAAELAAKGVKAAEEIAPRTGSWGRSPSFFIRDPDGYLIELKPR